MLEFVETIPSTNKALMMKENCREDEGIYTFHQTEGRGTRGRQWEEKQGENLALSLCCHLPIELVSPLPLVVGLGVRKALEKLGFSTKLKWSNDVVVSGKKLAGILCESRIAGKTSKIVIGVGVNLYQNQDDFDKRELSYATSLGILGFTVNGDELAALLREEIMSYVGKLKTTGFTKGLREEYESYCVTLGSSLEIHSGNGEVAHGQGIGIAPTGALICRLNTGEIKEIFSGDVSVRGIYGYI